MTRLVLGDLRFEVRRSGRRRTLGLTVERDGSLVLTAPPGVADARLARFAEQKRGWIYEKLAAREALGPALPARRFVSGEGLPYLGRSYRLLLVAEQDALVKLEGGRFRMRRDVAAGGRAVMIGWYTARAERWIAARIEPYAARARVRPADVAVRELGFRWGSCSRGGRLYFHWQSILLPPRVVDYVVVHELCHLIEAHHTPAFWRAVERLLPDWERRRRWLAEHAHEHLI